MLSKLTAADPKLQVWDGLTQKYSKAPMQARGITYTMKDLEQLAKEKRPKVEGPDDLPSRLRQRGGWSSYTGYTPTEDMPPFDLDPDSGPTVKIV